VSKIIIKVMDCIDFLSQFHNKFDLIFVDSPWNVNKNYYLTSDDKNYYLSWCEEWIKESFNALKQGGAFYSINTPKNSHLLFPIIKKYGIYRASIIWYKRASPPPSTKNYPNMYSTILYFTKGKQNYYNNITKIPFELKTKGKVIPHVIYDVWLDIPKVTYGYLGGEGIIDSNGKPILPNQLPVDLLKRIINISCPENGLVCDPFSGTGTTARACKILGRNFIGGDIDEHLVSLALQSLEKVGYQKPLEKIFMSEEFFAKK
jgi:site-specific DNA-methyltransferase (adenine-specific)